MLIKQPFLHWVYSVFKISKGTMPLKDVNPKKRCSYAPTYPHPPCRPTGWTPKGAVCEGTFVATVLLSSDSLYDHLGSVVSISCYTTFCKRKYIFETFTSVCPSCAQASCASLMF